MGLRFTGCLCNLSLKKKRYLHSELHINSRKGSKIHLCIVYYKNCMQLYEAILLKISNPK